MLHAITREVSPAIARCELTHLKRQAIDVALARSQHERYRALLRECGWSVIHLPADPDAPDSVFVEDAAIVVDEVAVITRPGAPSRRDEIHDVAAALERFRPLIWLQDPATLDGGDVLQLGRTIYVGQTARTNEAALAQLSDALAPRGYELRGVETSGCLHLKTAVTAVGQRTLLLNPDWVDPGAFARSEIIEVAREEPFAANALLLGPLVALRAAHPRTRARLEARGVRCRSLPASELAKAEGGLTCCSILIR